MKKFSEINYERINISSIKSRLTKNYLSFRFSDDLDRKINSIHELIKCEDELDTAFLLASIRAKLKPNDKYYQLEMDFYLREIPTLASIQSKFAAAIVKSKCIKEIEKKFGRDFILSKTSEALMRNRKVVNNYYFENQLKQRYMSMLSNPNLGFSSGGDKSSVVDILDQMTSKSESRRKRAYEDLNLLLIDNISKFVIFDDEFRNNRKKIAAKLGYSNYIEYVDALNQRLDFHRDCIQNFRNGIVNEIVPVAHNYWNEFYRLKELKTGYYYNENYLVSSENKRICESTNELKKIIALFFQLAGQEFKEFYKDLEENELFQVTVGDKNAFPCSNAYLPSFNEPIIYGRIYGTCADIASVLQDLGEAYWKCLKDKSSSKVNLSGKNMEQAISFVFELISVKYASKLFGNNANNYIRVVMINYLNSIIYDAMLDEYHEYLYEGKCNNYKDQCEKWLELQKKYIPWREYGDGKFFSKGAGWCVDTQAMLSPFQQIDYAYSAILALSLLNKNNKAEIDKADDLPTEDNINDTIQSAVIALKELIKG